MAENLPDVRYQVSYPKIARSVSNSRTGNRSIASVEYADPFWTISMRTVPLAAPERLLMEAFRDKVEGGTVTVIYEPKHQCIPRAYWGNANAPAVLDTGVISSFTHRGSFVTSSVTNGLTLGRGDIIGIEQGSYKTLSRIQTGGTASGGALAVTVEPLVPGFITTGATVVFKQPKMNCRVVSFDMTDDLRPVASFTLAEVAI